MSRWIAAALLTCAGIVGSAASQSDFVLARDQYPVVNGSTSTQPLGVLIAGRVTRTSVRWFRTSDDPTRRLFLTAEPYDETRRLSLHAAPADLGRLNLGRDASSIGPLFKGTSHSGTSQSYERLASGEAELVIAAREPTPAERDAIRKGGADVVTLPIARDAFVFLRHVKNTVRNLTLDQVRDIYGGVITSWKDVGGTDVKIVAYQREPTSGSQVEMEQLVMRGRSMIAGPDNNLTSRMPGPFNAVRETVGGIGYTYHYYERFMAGFPEITTVAINGVTASPETITNGRYPLVTRVYLAHRVDLGAGSPAARLRDWIASPAGQRVVAESGYVRLR